MMKKSRRSLMIRILLCLAAAILIAVLFEGALVAIKTSIISAPVAPIRMKPMRVALLSILLFAVLFLIVAAHNKESLARMTAVRDRLYDRRRPPQPRTVCKEARFFVIAALIAGLLLVFLTPPLCVPDEQVHYFNAYLVSEGAFADSITGGRPIVSIPRAVESLTDPGRYIDELNAKYSYAEMAEDADHEIDPTDRVDFVCAANPVGYLAAGFGMWFFRTFGAIIHISAQSSYHNLLFGRIANLFLYILLIAAAIRLIPCYKKTVTLIALMPMCLYQAASVSYDAPLIAASLLLCARTLALCLDTAAPIRRRDVAGIMLCTFLLAGIKSAAYLPLLSILLVIPFKKYHGLRTFVLCVASVLVAAVAGYLPGYINARVTAPMLSTAPAVIAQKEWVMGHIPLLPIIIGNTFVKNYEAFIKQLWGVLGWLDTTLPKPALFIGLILLFVIFLRETCSADRLRPGLRRLWILPGVVISFAAIFLSMYLYHTPLPHVTGKVGGAISEGVQGRYFIPLLLPMVIFFANGSFSWLTKGKADTTDTAAMWITIVGGIFSAVMTVLFILLRFWI